MFGFGKTAAHWAKNASSDAHRTKNALDNTAALFSTMEHKLHKIADKIDSDKNLQQQIDPEVMKRIALHMDNAKRHSEHMESEMNKLHQHVKKIYDKV